MTLKLLLRAVGAAVFGFGFVFSSVVTSSAYAQESPAGAQSPQAAPIDVQVGLGAASIKPSMTTLLAGQPYDFVVSNPGDDTQGLVIESLGATNKPLVAGDKKAAADGIAGGQTKRFVWSFDHAGEYQMAGIAPKQGQQGVVTRFTVVPADTPTVKVQLGDFSVMPATTELKADTPYLFEVTNTGAATHELVLEPAGVVDEPLTKEANGTKTAAEAEDIAPGQTKNLIWTFATPGDYQMACHVPGHYQAGMISTFNVIP